MCSPADLAQLIKTQKKILTEMENLTRDFKNKDPSYFNDLQVSKTSKMYTVTGRIDPFPKDDIKVYFSEDEKYLIVAASHETLFDRDTAFHKVVRKFRIEDKYNLSSMQYQITDNFITITVKAKDRSICEREEAPEEVTRKKKEPYMKVDSDVDLDLTMTSEGELLPRYVVERTTIDPEVLQRKIEIPPDLHFAEIEEGYVQIREDELDPCPEFERQIEEMYRKKLEEKLAEKERLAALQSTSVSEDTDTSIIREKLVAKDIMESEKEVVEKSEQITDEKDDETQKKLTAEKTEEVEDVGKGIEEAKKKTDDEEQPEAAIREEESVSESSKEDMKGKLQAKHGGEEKDKDSEKSECESPTKATKERREEEKVDKKESKEILPEATKVKQGEEKGLKVEKKDDTDSKETVAEIPAKVSKQQPDKGGKADEKVSKEIAPAIPPKVSKQQTDEGEERDDKDLKESVPEISAEASKQQPDKGGKTGDKDSKVIVPETPPRDSKQQPDEGEETDDKDSKETVPETPPKASTSKEQTDEGDKTDSRETTPGTPSDLPATEEKQSEDKGGAKGFTGLLVSESSNSYAITGRTDPLLKHNIKIYFSEDNKYLIVAVNETSYDRGAIFHKVEKQFRIEDKYNLNSVECDIRDKFFTITVKAEDQTFSELQGAVGEKVTRKKTGESVTAAAELDHDITSSEGEVEQKSGIQRPEVADDPEEAAEILKKSKVVSSTPDEENIDEKHLEEKTEKGNDSKIQEESDVEKTEEKDDEKSIESNKKKTVDEKKPETAIRKEEK